MNENHRYSEEEHRPDEGKQVQQELERQLREFGDTMSDAFRHGFEGRGEEIGDRVWGIGKATMDAANYGLDAAGRAVREGKEAYRKQAAKAGGSPDWVRQFFAQKKEPTPVDTLRDSAKKRRGAGHAMFWTGVVFAVLFGITAISCFGASAVIEPTMVGDAVAIGDDVITEVVPAIGGFAWKAVRVSAWAFSGVTALFGWLAAAGMARIKAGKNIDLYADMAEGSDYKKGLSLEMLADLLHQKKKKTLRQLRRYIRKGWLNAWLDEKSEKLYLTAEDYRTAQETAAPEPEPQPAPEETAEKVPLNLEVARSFVDVLSREKTLMEDERAVEELDHMQKTTQAICDWLESHPESLPKARRFAEYYIPTTLKLLHTYNDVQGQQGENAKAIRQDIAGILHTLNQAYDNLYDKLLSDMALDVSSEIAALQGMLANDGLTGEGML